MPVNESGIPGATDGIRFRLFTPAKFSSLAGMPFPSDPNYFPTKDEMGDYIENYAKHFDLPVRNNVTVDGLSREENKYCLAAGDQHFEAEHVVIAMSNYQVPKIPNFAKDINLDIVQIHSFQLQTCIPASGRCSAYCWCR